MRNTVRTILSALLLALVISCVAWAQTATEPPRYVLSSGVSYDSVGRQSSSVSTLAVLIAAPGGLPTMQTTTIETGLARQAGGTDNTATLRAGVAQTVYQRGNVALGVCGDAGVLKAGDVATLGTMSGCGWLSWDLGSRMTKGKTHVYIIPTVRLISVAGVQIKPSYALRIGTGF